MATTYEGQEFLIARDAFGRTHAVLGAIGCQAVRLARISDGNLCTVRGWDSTDFKPTEPGVWVWAGEVVYQDHPCFSLSFRCHGNWRPAVLGDFPRFGLPVPLPRLPEGVLA
jgi:hypothetical protein